MPLIDRCGGGKSANLQEKTVWGKRNASTIITPDNGFDGFSKAIVKTPCYGGYSSYPDSKKEFSVMSAPGTPSTLVLCAKSAVGSGCTLYMIIEFSNGLPSSAVWLKNGSSVNSNKIDSNGDFISSGIVRFNVSRNGSLIMITSGDDIFDASDAYWQIVLNEEGLQ